MLESLFNKVAGQMVKHTQTIYRQQTFKNTYFEENLRTAANFHNARPRPL